MDGPPEPAASAWECRAAQSRQARPEEAEEARWAPPRREGTWAALGRHGREVGLAHDDAAGTLHVCGHVSGEGLVGFGFGYGYGVAVAVGVGSGVWGLGFGVRGSGFGVGVES